MEIIQVTAMGIVGAVLAVTLRKLCPEYGMLLAVLVGVLIFLFLADKIKEVIGLLRLMAENAGIHTSYLSIVLKVIGIAYIAEFGTELCIDAGEHAIASKIQLGGKVLILLVASPVILALLDVVVHFTA